MYLLSTKMRDEILLKSLFQKSLNIKKNVLKGPAALSSFSDVSKIDQIAEGK